MRVAGAAIVRIGYASLLWRFGRLSYAQAMLPILRILPVGGVLLAIMLLVLALNPPDGSRAQLTPNVAPVRGALIARGEHPEWRQFLILAAIRRADELNRLRDLPDTPSAARRPEAPASKGRAGAADRQPADRAQRHRSGSDDETGSIVQPPAATIPIDIGETSSFELPVAAPEEMPPVIRTPQRSSRVMKAGSSRAAPPRRAKAPAAPKQPAPVQIFSRRCSSGPKPKQPPTAGANALAERRRGARPLAVKSSSAGRSKLGDAGADARSCGLR